MPWPRLTCLALLSLCAAPLAAQNAQCAPYQFAPYSTQDYNLCNAGVDGARILHPIFGLLLSGGNPVIGSVRGLGGLPHFGLTARVNASDVVTPDLGYTGTGTTVGQGKKAIIPAPIVEGALGIFPGLNRGFLSIDVLGSAILLPASMVSGLTVDPNARKIGSVALGLGYGVRVGVIPGRSVIPSVMVSAMRREIPRVTYGTVTAGGDNYSLSVDLHATNLRAIAGYRLSLLNLGAGVGWDHYTGIANVGFQPSGGGAAESLAGIRLDATRTMAFATAALDLPVFKIGAEAGYQFGKRQGLATTFSGNDPAERRLFGSLGVRLGF